MVLGLDVRWGQIAHPHVEESASATDNRIDPEP